jgi:hypothetical protein
MATDRPSWARDNPITMVVPPINLPGDNDDMPTFPIHAAVNHRVPNSVRFNWFAWVVMGSTQAHYSQFHLWETCLRLSFAMNGNNLWVYVLYIQTLTPMNPQIAAYAGVTVPNITLHTLTHGLWMPWQAFMATAWTTILSHHGRVFPRMDFIAPDGRHRLFDRRYPQPDLHLTL